MTAATAAMLRRWSVRPDRLAALDINDEMLGLTLDMIASTMLSLDIVAVGAEMRRAYADACVFLNGRLAAAVDLPLWAPTPANRRFNQAIETLDRLLAAMIAERRQQPAAQRDLLDRLLAARDETTGEGMSERQIRDAVWTFPRQAIADDQIAGYHIPASSLMFPAPYLTHRHPAFWDHPESFDPERFTPARSIGRHDYTYYPFSGGKRSCIGSSIARQQIQLVVATVAQQYQLRLAPG